MISEKMDDLGGHILGEHLWDNLQDSLGDDIRDHLGDHHQDDLQDSHLGEHFLEDHLGDNLLGCEAVGIDRDHGVPVHLVIIIHLTFDSYHPLLSSANRSSRLRYIPLYNTQKEYFVHGTTALLCVVFTVTVTPFTLEACEREVRAGLSSPSLPYHDKTNLPPSSNAK